MSDYLTNLIHRSLNADLAIRPRLPGRFERSEPVDDSTADGAFASQPATYAASSHPLPEQERVPADAYQPEQYNTAQTHPALPHTAGSTHARLRARQSLSSPTAPQSEPDARVQSTDATPTIAHTPEHARPLTQLHNPGAITVPTSVTPQTRSDANEASGAQAASPAKPVIHLDRTNTTFITPQLARPAASQPARIAVPAAAQLRLAPAPPAGPPADRVSAEPPAPRISVTIGRIDVRATTPTAPAPRAHTTPTAPALSLDDYLKRRNGDQR